MDIYEAKSLVEFLKTQMKAAGSNSKKRGGVKLLAESLGCHPTFVSQVIHEKAFLNHDQAFLCCKYFRLNEDETEFFMARLNFERAGSREAKKYFQSILDNKLRDRRIFYKRVGLSSSLEEGDEYKYFSQWIIPVVHAALQLPNGQTKEKLATLLRLKESDILSALRVLRNVNLVKEKNGIWKVETESLHIPSKSLAASNFHVQWRLKTAAKLTETERTNSDSHYSSLFAISEETAEKIRDILLQQMQKARKSMVESANPSRLYALLIDFYPITDPLGS